MRRIFWLTGLLVFFAPMAAKCQTCQASATPVSFGAYIPSSTTPTYSTGTVTVSCSALLALTISYTVTFNSGLYSGNSYTNIRMNSGNSYLLYQLYTDAAHTSVWGNATNGTSDQTGGCLIQLLGGLLPCGSPYTVYGKILPLQYSADPGSYSDTITVTVSYSSIL
jgi:spore coat protein U-like protein